MGLGMLLVVSVGAAMPGAVKPQTLATRGSVLALAADGDRVALVVRSSSSTRFNPVCAGVVVWEPIRRRVVRLQRPCRAQCCSVETQGVALAGTRAAWLSRAPGGNILETIVETATLARRKPVWVADEESNADGGYGDFARRPVGDGTLLAFTLDLRCGSWGPCPPGRERGDIVNATVWRVDSQGRCPYQRPPSGGCSRVAQADGELSVLAVDAGRIAVRTDSGVRLLTATGRVLQDFAVTARASALSGNRLAVRKAGAVEVYDTDSGELTAQFPAVPSLRLEDLDDGILVTAEGRTVTLRRLGDGRMRTIRAAGIAHAQLERPGLFVAAGRRVTFMPMRDVLRRLG
jgi:hypothetical protein